MKHTSLLTLPLFMLASCSATTLPAPNQVPAADLAPASDQLPAADLRPVPHTVVIIGSSTAAGMGASSPAASWAGRVSAAAAQRCPETRIVNLAVSGYTTWQGMPAAASRPAGRPNSDPAHNVEAAIALHPDLVMILFPSNDAASKFPLSETLANQTVLRDSVRAAGAVDLIIGPFPRSFTDSDSIRLMTGLRDQLPAIGAPRYVALWDALAATDSSVQAQYAAGDGIHLNDSGHAVIAQRVQASPAWAAACPARP